MLREPLVLLVVGFVFTSVLGGGLTYFFQRRNWQHQYQIQRLDLMRDQAMKTFQEVSTLLDQRLFRMRRVFWEAKARTQDPPDDLDAAREKYQAVLESWNDNRNRNLALVETYFGVGAREWLQFRLFTTYVSIHEELQQFVVREVLREDGPHPPRIRPIDKRLLALSQEVYRFNLYVLKLLRDGHLGDTAPTHIDLTSPTTAQFGDRGDLVRHIQQSLAANGEKLDIDGHFGPATEQAILRLQTTTHLPETGIADPTTIAALTHPPMT